MKTSVIEVRGMLPVLSVPGVEKRIGEVPGVKSVTVNFAAGSATVRYDETRLNVADIKSAVRQRGYASTGEQDKAAAGAPPPIPQPAVAKAGRPDDRSVKDSDEVATALGADLENGLTAQEAAEKIFGWPVAQMLGQSLSKLIPGRFQAAHAGHMARFGSTGSTSRRMGGSTLVHGQRANGEEFPIEASISQLDSAHGKLFTVILRDVSERVRAADELNALATQAHAIRESEKSRVARELHDELAQSLTALKMDANWVRDRLGDTAPAVTARINDMLTLLDATVAANRRIAADLRSLLLDDLGLVPHFLCTTLAREKAAGA